MHDASCFRCCRCPFQHNKNKAAYYRAEVEQLKIIIQTPNKQLNARFFFHVFISRPIFILSKPHISTYSRNIWVHLCNFIYMQNQIHQKLDQWWLCRVFLCVIEPFLIISEKGPEVKIVSRKKDCPNPRYILSQKINLPHTRKGCINGAISHEMNSLSMLLSISIKPANMLSSFCFNFAAERNSEFSLQVIPLQN